jgi:hypothetical protein
MDEVTINTQTEAVLYLAACALHGREPEEERLAGVDMAALYQVCNGHSLAAMVCMAIEHTAAYEACAPELKKQWQDTKNKSIRKNLLMDAARGEIFAWMEENGCWYMPLKGVILKDMYPKTGMRQMSDNDIFYDGAFQEQLRTYMLAHGYEPAKEDEGNHQTPYQKPPFYYFEMHTMLIAPRQDTKWYAYYRDIQDKLLPDGDKKYGRHFRDEDFYIYMMLHAYKHYRSGGIGLRCLVDTYVYLQEKEPSMDWSYIQGEETVLGILTFDRQCRRLASALFSQPDAHCLEKLSETEREAVAYFAGSGTYGTETNKIVNRIRDHQTEGGTLTAGTKLKYCLRRLFPDMDFIRRRYPFYYRHKWLLPYFYVWRILYRGITHFTQLVGEVKVINRAKK